MIGILYFLIFWQILGAFASIMMVDRERKPLTQTQAYVNVVITMLLVSFYLNVIWALQ